MSEQFVTTTKHFRKLLAAGYLLIVLLVGGIICTWLGEWRDLELLERENREIGKSSVSCPLKPSDSAPLC